MPKDEIEGLDRAERRITPQELEAARQTVRLCSGLSRLELARTICEHWGWVTASGSYKVTACLNVLEEWEDRGLLRLPGKRRMTRWKTDQASGAVPTERTNPAAPLVGELSEAGSLWLEVITNRDRSQLCNEYVERYHYLGYRQPFGCFLRYFIVSPAGLLGCVLMAGAAKALAGAGSLDRVGPAAEFAVGDQQHAPADFSVGTAPPLGQPCAGATGPPGAAGLASALGL